MTTSDWHASPALLARFADDPASVDDMTASSTEAHLVICADCRRHLAASFDHSLVLTSWEAIADRIDRPRPVLAERLLHRVGIDSAAARLLAATPALQLAGLAAVVILAVAAVVLSRTVDAEGPFLVLAPLVPLAAVAATFAPANDPAGEAAVGTPLHGVGLLVRRAVTVLLVTFGLLGVAALALPDLGPVAAAWVLPALALALGALAIGTWTRVEVAVTILAGAWLLSVWSVWWLAGRDVALAESVTFAVAGQAAALLIAAAAVAVVVVRRDCFATLEAFR
jgi:hypothetical protein